MRPTITRTGTIVAVGRDVEVNGGSALHLALLATPDETEAARALGELHRVRVTIEPVEPEAPTPGDPLDYLAELKGILIGLRQDLGATSWDQSDRAISRCLSLANSAHLAIVAARRSTP